MSVDEKWFVRQQQCIPRIRRQHTHKKLHQITHYTQHPFTHTHTHTFFLYIVIITFRFYGTGEIHIHSNVLHYKFLLRSFFVCFFCLLNAQSNCFTSVCSFFCLLLRVYFFFYFTTIIFLFYYHIVSRCLATAREAKKNKIKERLRYMMLYVFL